MSNKIEYYCVGFFWYGKESENQLPRFLNEGIWENGFENKYLEKVKSIPVGTQLAAKTSYTRKNEGKIISVLEVHAIGTVISNIGDGRTLKVEWKKDFKPFKIDGRGAYRSTISRVILQENIDLIFGDSRKTENDALAFDINDIETKFPLNQILYGPPGTGKTYNTINKSISIIDNLKEVSLNKYYPNRIDLKERFDELIIDDWENPIGQIGFITFHQSMSYEDFIEGIKPDINENQNVIYDKVPGIFKSMVSLAKSNWLDANRGQKEQLSFEEAFAKFKEEWQENQEMKFPLRTSGYEFTILDFTKTSIRFKKASGGIGHTLSISTLRDYFYSIKEIRKVGVGIYYPPIIERLKSYEPSFIIDKEEKKYVLIIDEINRGNISQIFGELITLIEADKRLGNEEALEVTLPYSKDKFGVPSNLYIIGTMNTADRSVEALDTALRRRFSFTEFPPEASLLENTLLKNYFNLFEKYWDLDWEDKIWTDYQDSFCKLIDAEAYNAIPTKIWQSKKYTNNNTKLKSQWELAECVQFFKDNKVKVLDIEKLLFTVNSRLEKLLNKDHQIGHSFFFEIEESERPYETLVHIFQNKIIPLLQEFFYADYGKIGLVLGNSFIEKKNDAVMFATFDSYEEHVVEDLESRSVYVLKPTEKWNFWSIYE